MLTKYKFEYVFDSINLRGIETKIIIKHSVYCDDFKDAWDEALEIAFNATLPHDYELVTIHYKGAEDDSTSTNKSAT